jgi:hypothetical protein
MRKIDSNTVGIVALVACAAVALPSYAADARGANGRAGSAAVDSRSFKAEVLFRLQNPCPATGEAHGDCKGYVIDRIIPIACGGTEEPSNMQWQTAAEARAKDRWEKIGCRPGRKLVMPTPAVDADVFPMQEAPETPQAEPLPRG